MTDQIAIIFGIVVLGWKCLELVQQGRQFEREDRGESDGVAKLRWLLEKRAESHGHHIDLTAAHAIRLAELEEKVQTIEIRMGAE